MSHMYYSSVLYCIYEVRSTYPTQHQGHKTQLIHHPIHIPTDPTPITKHRVLCCSRSQKPGHSQTGVKTPSVQSLLGLRHAQGLI